MRHDRSDKGPVGTWRLQDLLEADLRAPFDRRQIGDRGARRPVRSEDGRRTSPSTGPSTGGSEPLAIAPMPDVSQTRVRTFRSLNLSWGCLKKRESIWSTRTILDMGVGLGYVNTTGHPEYARHRTEVYIDLRVGGGAEFEENKLLEESDP